ncbi:MAG: strE 2 [Deltaproteobacteria bacterium]|nr:strE 2 [Deltaproteobacteria bacterium]
MPRNVFVTGAVGFIGSHVSEALLARGDRVFGLDNFDPFYDRRIKESNLANLSANPSFSFLEGDIRDPSGLARWGEGNPPNAVIHLAAKAGVRPSVADPVGYADVNIQGTLRMLEWARERQVPKILFASSSSVYGGNPKVPFSEDDFVDHPVSPYAASKKAGELFCHTYCHLYGMNVVALRLFTVYGPRQRPEMAIHKFTRRILDGEEIDLYGDGTSRRDYTLIEKACGKPAVRRFRPLQPGDVPVTYADISRARTEIGYDPRTPIGRGVFRFVEWYRRQETTRPT